MNASDRKQVAKILEKLKVLVDEMDALQPEIQELADGEQEKFDNMSEGLQGGDQGQAIEAAASQLSEAASSIESHNLEETIALLESIE